MESGSKPHTFVLRKTTEMETVEKNQEVKNKLEEIKENLLKYVSYLYSEIEINDFHISDTKYGTHYLIITSKHIFFTLNLISVINEFCIENNLSGSIEDNKIHIYL